MQWFFNIVGWWLKPYVMREEQKASWRVVMDQCIFMFSLAFDPNSGSQLCSGRVRDILGSCWSKWEVGYMLCWIRTSNQNFSITHQTWEKLVRAKGEWHHGTSARHLLTETESRKWRSADAGWAHTANFPVVLTSVEDALKERKLQVCSFEEVRSWKCPGRLSCAVLCWLLCKTVQKKPTFQSY